MRRPRFIAAQARHASGPLGRLIAWIMARETWRENLRAIEALGIGESDHILDIGCGHGRSLGELASRAPRGHITGADPSSLMAGIATRRNRKLVKSRRIDIAVAKVEALPFPDNSFDKALCVHVLYFWNDLDTGLKEIARVLKPNARLALIFRPNTDPATQAFPPEIYRFPAISEVIAALKTAGFTLDEPEAPTNEPQTRPTLLVATRRV